MYNLFNQQDVKIILKISLDPSMSNDIFVWHYVNDGCFLIKIVYHLGMDCCREREEIKQASQGKIERFGNYCGTLRFLHLHFSIAFLCPFSSNKGKFGSMM